jgi:hypothetical protein
MTPGSHTPLSRRDPRRLAAVAGLLGSAGLRSFLRPAADPGLP